MRPIVMASLGVAALCLGTHASADTEPETCTLELEDGVTGAWVGPCTDGKADGEGFAVLLNGTYTGTAVDGLAEGQGRLTLRGGARYEGSWARGKRDGWGSSVDAEGNRYEGEYADGKPHGQGSGSSPGGGHHSGQWRSGEPIAEPEPADVAAAPATDVAETPGNEPEAVAGSVPRCKLEIAGESADWSGSCSEDGKAYGQGTATSADGTATYTGSAENGKPHGFGTVTTSDGGYYQGDYRNGLQHGTGAFRGPDGKLYRATFADGAQESDAVPMEGVAAVDPWADYREAEPVPQAGGATGKSDDPWAQTAAEDPDPWAQETTADESQTTGSSAPGAYPEYAVGDDFDSDEALKALGDEDGIVRSAIPTEYEEALRDLDRKQRLEVERRTTEQAREMDEFARETREEIEAETARERRAEAQRDREQRDAELTERAIRLEQERQAEEWKRQAEERERKSKALMERNLQIVRLQQNLNAWLETCDARGRRVPRPGLCWVGDEGQHRERCRQKWEEEKRQAEIHGERERSECREQARSSYQTELGHLMLRNP